MPRITIYLFLFILLFTSCKKYDEGPWISFNSKDKRLIGTWELEKFIVNGYDSTHYFRKYDSPIFAIVESGIYISLEDVLTAPNNPRKGLSGYWSFEDKKRALRWVFTNQGNQEETWIDLGPFGIDRTSFWEIKRLKMDELFLETNYDGSFYRIEFSRK